ncbi:rod shape-determining protein MreC [Aerococcus urinaeequi]|uniref:Cell shape-determining protein MreC n=1 Tax=Aerococcus urinaeequi TaxID=51665 RepID=A0AAF0BKG7_9LACT|nr:MULTISPECIES: rod shape-determining protein MreC [Lactobacillales]KAF3298752.1 rod shape-determining protein MreC [Carnobacterium sp. PL26RED25]KAF3303932.1 rod shape-determining protein MreC [Carnobacterium sp. PL24RED07]KAF3306351.1 rod shape-determining protein MreC [Carnobacterium sp. PL17GRE32]WCG38371.1 rod shape-determining protein MreC [Aerococcus urinaeequi]
MRRFFENKKLIVLLVSVITSFSMIAYSIFSQSQMPKPILWVNDVTAVVGRFVSTPTNAMMRFTDSINDLMNTYEDNQRLKSQISSLEELEAQNEILQSENEELSALLDLQPSLVGKNVIASSVISRSPDTWLDSITIDVGTNSGIEENMSVMTESGLVGHVTEVSATSSKVQLLITENNQMKNVAVSIQTDDGIVSGILSDYDEKTQELILKQVPNDAKVSEGNTVTTSGLGGVSPEGLIIGEVTSASSDNFGLSQSVRVKPAADFKDIRSVLVIMTLNESSSDTSADSEDQAAESSAASTDTGE